MNRRSSPAQGRQICNHHLNYHCHCYYPEPSGSFVFDQQCVAKLPFFAAPLGWLVVAASFLTRLDHTALRVLKNGAVRINKLLAPWQG